MDEPGIEPDKMELVVVTYVVDAITFWAQNVTDKANEKISAALLEKCPTAPILMGKPTPHKVYGARYSEDMCWYRCTVQEQTDDKFYIVYIDYGNMEIVSRSELVELPEDLQSTGLAKKYKFWGFHVSSEEDTPLFTQGKSFLQNMINGKKLRVHKKSVCSDGTILVRAFQGNLDIGQEMLKFRLAEVNLPVNMEISVNLQEHTGLWPARSPPKKGDALGCMPKLRPIFSDQKPQIKEQKTIIALQPVDKLNNEQEHYQEINSSAKSQQNNYETEQRLNETNSELQRMREVIKEKEMEITRLKEEGCSIQQHEALMGQQLEEAILELQTLKESYVEIKNTEHNHPLSLTEKITQLAKKVDSLRKLRESKSCPNAEDHLLESITVIMNYRISVPMSSQKLEVAWKDYYQALENLKACENKSEMQLLVRIRNEAQSSLVAAVNDFQDEVDMMPIAARWEKLKDIESSLTALFSSVSPEEKIDKQSFETFCDWKRDKYLETKNVQQITDDALMDASNWAARLSKFLCLMEKTSVTEHDVTDGVHEIFVKADAAMNEELKVAFTEQENQEKKIVFNAFSKAVQDIRKEQSLLEDIRQKYKLNTEFKQEMEQWQNGPPKLDQLQAVKKNIRSLRAQLRWKLVEVSCLEEAEKQDLPEILKKKEEITETRNALFREISHEKKQYSMLCALMNRGFPELPLIFPDVDINSYTSSAGLLMKSLDRDMFDAEPMKELSGRRPLLSTDFQGQKVVLKCYTVDEDSEEKMLKQAALYHTAQQQTHSTAVPLLALFFGKSDPLGYVMVPHYSNNNLRSIQKSSPLSSSEIKRAMRGVALGLQNLHAASLIHASLHPSNVFVIAREKGIVGDYDFTKTPDQRATDSGMVAGSISLVAPELRNAQHPSTTTDIYAFGGIMLWLHVPDFNVPLKRENQHMMFTGSYLDDNLQVLLTNLLISSERLSAAEILKDDYFSSSAV